ncbi:hypothetical protein MNBD_NITROSPIRAE01-769 [hydrothermal vent metagenome]|uniref:Uncharacterized protein n=1 Tax=hydrothermal vent metagenome TaxID=652676 RepID=A0A3B1C8U7_9ZZZZ
MNTHAGNTQENKKQSVSNERSQKQSDGKFTSAFLDDRPEAVTQRKIQEVANNSPQVSQLKVLQKMMNNKQGAQLEVMADHLPSQSAVVQRRSLSSQERNQLVGHKERFVTLKDQYESHKTAMHDALSIRGFFNDMLGYLHALKWDHAIEEIDKQDTFFEELADLSRRAGHSSKGFDAFKKKLNFYENSGGSNKFFNIYKDMDSKLLSQERNFPTQFTKMDEIYFDKYMANGGSPISVYRGDGRDVTSVSFNTLPFSDMPAGGTTDISFAGVVEHTHTNTLKNGMVSTSTDLATGLFFATDAHEYGVVWELKLDNYIHVTNLLKARNFKYRFPDQYEVLAPGAISASKIVSATLYRKNTIVRKRTS